MSETMFSICKHMTFVTIKIHMQTMMKSHACTYAVTTHISYIYIYIYKYKKMVKHTLQMPQRAKEASKHFRRDNFLSWGSFFAISTEDFQRESEL